jgi:hypothetical protein
MIEEAKQIIKEGDPGFWAKNKENILNVNKMGKVFIHLTGKKIDCTWCARSEIYNYLKRWLKGNGYL